jgi:hypothetical protein
MKGYEGKDFERGGPGIFKGNVSMIKAILTN